MGCSGRVLVLAKPQLRGWWSAVRLSPVANGQPYSDVAIALNGDIGLGLEHAEFGLAFDGVGHCLLAFGIPVPANPQ